jgi:hypothetical protein
VTVPVGSGSCCAPPLTILVARPLICQKYSVMLAEHVLMDHDSILIYQMTSQSYQMEIVECKR